MKDIQLFDYQEDMVKRVQEAFRQHDAVMVQMPTGTGKTMVLSSIVFSFLEKSNKPVWIVAHRRELVSQIRETIQRVIFSNHHVPLSKEGNLPTTPSLLHKGFFESPRPSLTKEGSTFSPSPSSSGSGDVAGDAIALPEFLYRQRSLCISSAAFGNLKASFHCTHLHELCPQGADDDFPTQQSCDCLSAGASDSSPSLSAPSSLKSVSNVSDEIEVLVSVDLFSEGFDCPDVEFIQLARPTLSLAKYMQMVGRGLRVAEGKECCVILDNVGLYKRFGLPSADRDWQSMFEGRTSLEDILQEACLQVNGHNCRMDVLMDGEEEMMKILSHERQQRMIMDSYGYSLVENDKGLLGIKDKDNHVILDCLYKKIEVANDGFAYCYIRKKAGRKEWLDLRNGLWFMKKPQSVRLLGIDFCTEDGKRLYPRIRSKFIDEKAFLTVKTLELQVGTGISWKRRFIPWDEPNEVYMLQERQDYSRLYIDDDGHYLVQENIGSQLVKVDSPEDLATFAQKDKTERENDAEALKKVYQHYEFYPVDKVNPAQQIHRNKKCENEITIEKDGIWHVEDDWYHESYWVDPVTQRKHYTRPSLFRRGFVNILKVGDWCYIRNIPGLKYKPLRQWEIVADDNICVINNEYLFVKEEHIRFMYQGMDMYGMKDSIGFEGRLKMETDRCEE